MSSPKKHSKSHRHKRHSDSEGEDTHHKKKPQAIKEIVIEPVQEEVKAPVAHEEEVRLPPAPPMDDPIEDAGTAVVHAVVEEKSIDPIEGFTEEDRAALEEDINADTRLQAPVKDLMLQLSVKMGCYNLYYKNMHVPEFDIQVVPNTGETKKYQKFFYRLNKPKSFKQSFLNERLYGDAFRILTPICALGYSNLPPYGNINARNFAPEPKDWHKATVQIGALPETGWKWNSNAPLADPIAVQFWDWMENILEPAVYDRLKKSKLDEDKPWRKSTVSPRQPDLRLITAESNLFRNPRNSMELNLLRSGEYNAATAQLSRMCRNRGVVENFLPFYQLPHAGTTQEPLHLDWKQIANISNGSLYFAVLRVGLTVKETCHLDYTIERFVYLGRPEQFNDMQACTLKELGNCIVPLKPLDQEVWDVKCSTEEAEELKDALDAYRKLQGPPPTMW